MNIIIGRPFETRQITNWRACFACNQFLATTEDDLGCLRRLDSISVVAWGGFPGNLSVPLRMRVHPASPTGRDGTLIQPDCPKRYSSSWVQIPPSLENKSRPLYTKTKQEVGFTISTASTIKISIKTSLPRDFCCQFLCLRELYFGK